MKFLVFSLTILVILQFTNGVPLRLQKRAAFYIANETACVVDDTVYSNGDPIPTDDPCEACKCRPPGFACVLKDCQVKPGCRAVRRTGHCCPDYICGCEHNGRMYRDGDEIRDSQNPCYTCHCTGSSIACAFVDCFFRVDCAPEYVQGECCPRYTNCTENQNVPFEGKNPYLIEKQPSVEVTTSPESSITPGVSYIPDTTKKPIVDTTVIEIFNDETKKPELHLNHDVVDSQTEKVEESPSTEQDKKQDTSTVIDEHKVTTPDTLEVEKSESPEDERSTATEVNSNHDDSMDEVQKSSEETVSSEEESHTTSVPEETERYTTEINSQSDLGHTTVIAETVDVESEEPNNALESDGAASNYGISLKFPNQDEPLNTTVLEDAEPKNVSTEEPQESKLTENTGEPQENTSDVSNPVKASDKIISSDKNLYYNTDEELKIDFVESVTTEANVKEQTQPLSTETTTPVSSTKSENLFKSSHKLEEENKENVSESATVIVKPDGELEKTKETTVLFSTLEVDTITNSESEKGNSENKKTDGTSSSQIDTTVTSTSVL